MAHSSPKVHRVTDVDEAIELAQQLQAQGQYNWFRGQVQRWPAYSSLFRLQCADRAGWEAQYKPRLARFYHWMHTTPGLEALVEDADAFFAIAQHHGIPTHMIDFSTDPAVAGFFSADSSSPVSGDTISCIYCLDIADLAKVWKQSQEIRREVENEVLPDIQFITPHVPNLWRMQAQTGVFLECSTNWDVVYPMDRIEFPYIGYPSYPTKETIYPTRRSPLELLLDHFFDNEQKLEGEKTMREMLAQMRARGANVSYTEADSHEEYFVPDAFRGGHLPVHDSWEGRARWLGVKEELHADVRHVQIPMVLNFQAEPAALFKRARTGFAQALRREADARRHPVQWLLNPSAAPIEASTAAGLTDGLGRLWDGMRRQPFTDAQLANAMATWVCLGVAGYAEAPFDQRQQIAEKVLGGPVIQLEFRSADGASSRGWATHAALRAAMRPDLDEWWADDDKREKAHELNLLLQMCYSPQRLFVFDALLDLFVAQVGPTQLNRSEPYFFHPGRLQILGLP